MKHTSGYMKVLDPTLDSGMTVVTNPGNCNLNIYNDGSWTGDQFKVWPNVYPLPTPWPTPVVPYTPPIQQVITVTTKPRAAVVRKTTKRRAPVRRGTKTKETFITLLLDKSGSMQSCYDSALAAINEQIQVIKKNAKKGGHTYVSLILFSDSIDVVYENIPAAQVKPLERSDYVLCGCTALRDAILTGIELMEERQAANKNQGFLSVLISDGQENASGTTKEALRSRIQTLQTTDKWTFTYMLDGHSWEAIQDVSYYSSTTYGNIATYNATSRGTLKAAQVMCNSIGSYMDGRSKGLTSSETFFTDKDSVLDATVESK